MNLDPENKKITQKNNNLPRLTYCCTFFISFCSVFYKKRKKIYYDEKKIYSTSFFAVEIWKKTKKGKKYIYALYKYSDETETTRYIFIVISPKMKDLKF